MTPSDSQVHDMSSEEEELARTGGKSHKKRRVGRACDMCRQKKGMSDVVCWWSSLLMGCCYWLQSDVSTLHRVVMQSFHVCPIGDGDEGRRCSNCITFDDECTYIHSAPKVCGPLNPQCHNLTRPPIASYSPEGVCYINQVPHTSLSHV